MPSSFTHPFLGCSQRRELQYLLRLTFYTCKEGEQPLPCFTSQRK